MKQYIILGERGAMAWLPSNEQLCYVDVVGKRYDDGEKPFLVQTYSLEDAQKYMQLSDEFRVANGYPLSPYKLNEIDLSSYVKLIQDVLYEQMQNVTYSNGYPVQALPKAAIVDLEAMLKLEK